MKKVLFVANQFSWTTKRRIYESNEVYIYFQLHNTTNDTIISMNLRIHDYVVCEKSTKIGMDDFKLFHSI
jgi:hypothetical protein